MKSIITGVPCCNFTGWHATTTIENEKRNSTKNTDVKGMSYMNHREHDILFMPLLSSNYKEKCNYMCKDLIV